jgi:hypothetical protein
LLHSPHRDDVLDGANESTPTCPSPPLPCSLAPPITSSKGYACGHAVWLRPRRRSAAPDDAPPPTWAIEMWSPPSGPDLLNARSTKVFARFGFGLELLSQCRSMCEVNISLPSQVARAPTSPRRTGSCAIWGYISSSSSSRVTRCGEQGPYLSRRCAFANHNPPLREKWEVRGTCAQQLFGLRRRRVSDSGHLSSSNPPCSA